MKRYFLLFYLCFVMILIVGCSSAKQPNVIDNEESKNADVSYEPPHKGTVTVGNKIHNMETGGFSWATQINGQTVLTQTDHEPPSVIARDMTAITVEEGSQVEINVEGDPTLQAFVLIKADKEKTVPIKNNELIVEDQPGRYPYAIFAEWPEGKMVYVFVIEVE